MPFREDCRFENNLRRERLSPRPEDEPTHQDIFDALMEIREKVKRLEERIN